jgi:hypothetical protein
VPIRVVDVLHQVGRVQQHDQMLCEHRGGGDAELLLADEDGPGLGHSQRGAHDGHVDVGRRRPVIESGRVGVAAHLADGRTDPAGVRKGRRQPGLRIGGRPGEHLAVQSRQRGGEQIDQISRVAAEIGYLRRFREGRAVIAHGGEDVIT